jgi:plasmid replication initiation protein
MTTTKFNQLTKAEKQQHAILSEKDKIKFSNALARSAQMLSLNEIRLIYLAVQKIEPGMKMIDYIKSEGTTVTAAEFRKAYGMSQKSAVDALKAAVANLYERSIVWKLDSSDETWTRWLGSRTRYRDGRVTIKFNPDLIENGHLLQIKNNFVLLSMNHIAEFKSAHSINLYRVLKSYEFVTYQTIKLENLHHQLYSSASSLKDFGNFRKEVLEKAIKEINQHTDLNVSYTTTRGAANKVLAVNFIFGADVAEVETQTDTATVSRRARSAPDFEAAVKMIHKANTDAILAIPAIELELINRVVAMVAYEGRDPESGKQHLRINLSAAAASHGINLINAI